METKCPLENPLVILNPVANRGKMSLYRRVVRERLVGERAEYVETARRGEARELAQQAAQAERPVVIIGGDGSVHEVVNGLLAAGSSVPLGVVAAGSGNDFAWNMLQLPRDPVVALERALTGRSIAVDAGIVNGTYFANAFSVGLDADIGAAADAMKKFPLLSGARLYYAAIMRQLLFGYHRCPRLTFQLDQPIQVPQEERRYVLIAVSNGPAYGAGFRINPNADHTDGLFDVCTIDYTPLLRALQLLPIAKRGQHAGLPEVTFYRTSTIAIQSAQPVTMQMDGETVQATQFEAKILPSALQIRV